MKAIITGAGGFLGWELALAARQAGYRVTGIGRANQPPAAGVLAQWLAADLRDPTLRDQDWSDHAGATIFHLAANTRLYEAGRQVIADDIAMAETAVALAQQTGGGLVFFSSAAVYSGATTEHPAGRLEETAPTEPRTCYGQAKRAAEQVILSSGVDARIMRLFGVLGARLLHCPERGNLAQAVARASRLGGEVVIGVDATGGTDVRDYASAQAVCRFALQWAASIRAKSGEAGHIVNFCTGIPVSVEGFLAEAERAGWSGFTVRCERRVGGHNRVMVGDPERLRQLAGWIPQSAAPSFWREVARDQGNGFAREHSCMAGGLPSTRA